MSCYTMHSLSLLNSLLLCANRLPLHTRRLDCSASSCAVCAEKLVKRRLGSAASISGTVSLYLFCAKRGALSVCVRFLFSSLSAWCPSSCCTVGYNCLASFFVTVNMLYAHTDMTTEWSFKSQMTGLLTLHVLLVLSE